MQRLHPETVESGWAETRAERYHICAVPRILQTPKDSCGVCRRAHAVYDGDGTLGKDRKEKARVWKVGEPTGAFNCSAGQLSKGEERRGMNAR